MSRYVPPARRARETGSTPTESSRLTRSQAGNEVPASASGSSASSASPTSPSPYSQARAYDSPPSRVRYAPPMAAQERERESHSGSWSSQKQEESAAQQHQNKKMNGSNQRSTQNDVSKSSLNYESDRNIKTQPGEGSSRYNNQGDKQTTTPSYSSPTLNSNIDQSTLPNTQQMNYSSTSSSSIAQESPPLLPSVAPSTSQTNLPSSNQKVRVVEIDSLVLIKVLKHCRDNYPTPVNGQLLGMDTGDKLEITSGFPLPQKKDIFALVQKEKSAANDREIDEKVDEKFEKYQDKMAELMHDINVDCFTVGWYQTLSFGDLKSKETIDSLVIYQEVVDKAVMLGYDPRLNAMGKMAFKAFRVSEEFLSKYHAAEEDFSIYSKMKSKDILIEVPIIIKNSLLIETFLVEWSLNDPNQNMIDYDALDLDQNNFLEKNLTFLSNCLENLSEEQEKLQRYQRDYVRQQQLQKQIIERRKLENEQKRLRGEIPLPMEFEGPAFRKIEQPSQVHTLLMSNYIDMQCKEINELNKENLAKMFLVSKCTPARAK